ncbi:unnamed protein product [Boreogadus saida]
MVTTAVECYRGVIKKSIGETAVCSLKHGRGQLADEGFPLRGIRVHSGTVISVDDGMWTCTKTPRSMGLQPCTYFKVFQRPPPQWCDEEHPDAPLPGSPPVRRKGTDPTQVLIQQPLQPLPVNPLQTQARLPISKGLFGNPSRALRPGIPPRCPSLSSRGRPLNHSARQGKQTPVCPLIRRGKTSGGGGGALGQHGSQTDPRLIHLNPSPSITPAESACLTPTTLAFLTGTGLRIVCHS